MIETLHEASGNGPLQSLYKSLPCDDLDLFYCKVNLDCICRKLSNVIEGKNVREMGK